VSDEPHDRALIRENCRECPASDDVGECQPDGEPRIDVLLEPQPQTIELHAVAQPISGRKITRSKTAPAAPKRARYSYQVTNRTPSSVGMYFQYPLPSRISESGSSDPKFRADTELPSGKFRGPAVSPIPLTSRPKPIRVAYQNRCGALSSTFGR